MSLKVFQALNHSDIVDQGLDLSAINRWVKLILSPHTFLKRFTILKFFFVLICDVGGGRLIG